ncbi:MAG: YkgJ family cysteine cluster protein [Candidatus Kapaibacterium sp.]
MQTKNHNKLKETILKEYPRLSREDKFSFACHPGVECFNKCCNDVNIFLTPYDIIRLRQRLGMGSSEFLEKYTLIPLEENLKHPVVMLRMDEESLNCPFVEQDKGCTVYEDRPWSCRMYPIGVATPQEIADNNEEFFFLLKENFCKGFDESKEWTIEEWMNNQGVADYDEMGDMFREISLHPHFQRTQNTEPVKLEMFYMVMYDLDKFREFVFESTFFKRFDVPAETIEKMRSDDVELQKFGMQWLRFAIFGEKTINIRQQYAPKQ